MSKEHDEPGEVFEEVADAVVELANAYGDGDDDVDPWEVAAGMLAGTVQFWLYAHQPCDKSDCDDCEPVSTAHLRLKMLLDEVRELAETSEYFHSPNDSDVGRA
jgi:hypothetical protein